MESESVFCEMFDPPFLATTGKSLSENTESNKINKRFGVYPSEQDLHQFYIDSMRESYRLLKDKGILIFKCQDKISSDKQYMSQCVIIITEITFVCNLVLGIFAGILGVLCGVVFLGFIIISMVCIGLQMDYEEWKNKYIKRRINKCWRKHKRWLI